MKTLSEKLVIFFCLGMASCVAPEDNYINQALTRTTGTNEISYTPKINSYKLEGGTLRLDGENLNEVLDLQLGNTSFQVTKKSNETLIAMAKEELIVTSGAVMNLFISSSYGQSVTPLEISILDSAVTTGKIADGAVTTEKLTKEAVTLDKLSTADANDGDVVVYSRSQGRWIPGTIGGLGNTSNNVTSITMGKGLKTDGGDPTITSSGTMQVDIGHSNGQIIALTENTEDPSGPGFFEHNGIIRAYAVDKDYDNAFEEGEDYGQFSLVNTFNSTSAPRFDYRLSFDGSTVTNMVIKEQQNNTTFLEFDSNDARMYAHQQIEFTHPVEIIREDVDSLLPYTDYLFIDNESYNSSDASFFMAQTEGQYSLLTVSDGASVNDLHVTNGLFLQGNLRATKNARFGGSMYIDGVLEVDQITGLVDVSGGLSISTSSTLVPVFQFNTDGTFVVNDPDDDSEMMKFNADGSFVVKNKDGERTFEVTSAGEGLFKSTVTEGVDYAEWFEAEEESKPGDVIGINLSSGKARLYRPGDYLIGVASTKPGVTGGVRDKNKTQILVGLMGQVPVSEKQTKEKNGYVYTLDNKRLGVRLASGDIFINHTTSETNEDRLQRLVLEQKVKKLEEMVSKLIK